MLGVTGLYVVFIYGVYVYVMCTCDVCVCACVCVCVCVRVYSLFNNRQISMNF